MTGPAAETLLRSPQIHLGSKQVLRVVCLNASRSLLKLLSWGRTGSVRLPVVLHFQPCRSNMKTFKSNDHKYDAGRLERIHSLKDGGGEQNVRNKT